MLTIGQILNIQKRSELSNVQFSKVIGFSQTWLNSLTFRKTKEQKVRDSVSKAIYEKFPGYTGEFLKDFEIRKLQHLIAVDKQKEVKHIKVEKELVKLTITFDEYVKNVSRSLKGELFKKRDLEEMNVTLDEENIYDILRVAINEIK